MRGRRRRAVLAAGPALAVLLAACSSGPATDGATSPPASTTAPGCTDYAAYGSHAGTTVTVLEAGTPADRAKLASAWASFESCTGITVRFQSGVSLESLATAGAPSSGAPSGSASSSPIRRPGTADVAFVAQPLLLQALARAGVLVPAPASVAANVDRYWNPVWKTYGTVDDTLYAAPLSATMKSFVWYSPSVFAAKGYAVPTTWDGLWTLSERMASDGLKPWCGGLVGDVATGLPATDWLEETVLRQAGGDVYDRWVAHDVKFDSPAITEAMDQVALWMKNSRYVNAGIGPVASIAVTPVATVGRHVLDGSCGMLSASASYADRWAALKPAVRVAEDGDVFAFYLPSLEATQDCVETVGDFVAAFSDRPEVQQFQAFLSSATFATARARLGGWVSANNGVDIGSYRDAVSVASARHLTDPAALVRYDASELMPAEVGLGAMPAELTDWFAVNKPTKDVLDAIDLAWPSG